RHRVRRYPVSGDRAGIPGVDRVDLKFRGSACLVYLVVQGHRSSWRVPASAGRANVAGYQETCVGQDVRKGDRDSFRLLTGRCRNAAGRSRCQHRAYGEAQLVEQTGLGQLAKQIRPALGQDLLIPELAERGDSLAEIDPDPPGREDPHLGAQRGYLVGGCGGTGDQDRLGVRGRGGEQLVAILEIEAPGYYGDRG